MFHMTLKNANFHNNWEELFKEQSLGELQSSGIFNNDQKLEEPETHLAGAPTVVD